jgi:hypothetical protein
LNHSTERSDGADLGAHELLHFGEELVGGNSGGGVVSCGEGNEGEWEMAFECVWDADDAAFGDGRVGRDSLFDGAYTASTRAKKRWGEGLTYL